PGGSEATLEPAPHPVWQQHWKPLGCPALSLLHGFLHHRGAGLLHHRRSHRTHERKGLPRHRRVHPEVGQHLRLTPAPFLTLSIPPLSSCVMRGDMGNSL
ncbi:hypothetical protein XENOCAPTIV_026063, partial [Xenoophorus captivus]